MSSEYSVEDLEKNIDKLSLQVGEEKIVDWEKF